MAGHRLELSAFALGLDGARVRIALPRSLEVGAIAEAARQLPAILLAIDGAERVGLLVDARALREAGARALEDLERLERAVGQAVPVARAARLVDDAELASEANLHARAAGIDGAIRAFTREDEAVAFLESP